MSRSFRLAALTLVLLGVAFLAFRSLGDDVSDGAAIPRFPDSGHSRAPLAVAADGASQRTDATDPHADSGSEQAASTVPAKRAFEPLPVERRAWRVRALVLDSERRPLEGATLTAVGMRDHPTASAGPEGEVVLALEGPEIIGWPIAGAAEAMERNKEPFFITAPGHTEHLVQVRLGGGRDVELGVIQLEPAGAVEGRVLGPSGTPCEGAIVSVAPPMFEQLSDAQSQALRHGTLIMPGADGLRRTDGAGQYRIEGLAAGELVVLGVADGTLSNWSAAVQVVPGEVTQVDDLKLETLNDEGRVEGIVLGPDGEPSGGAWVQSRWTDGQVAGSGSLVRTRNDGRFVAPALPGKDIELNTMGAEEVVVPAGTPDVVLRRTQASFAPPVVAGVDVRGTVLDGGLPVAGAVVYSTPSSTVVETDEQGRFTLRVAKSGALTVHAHADLGSLRLIGELGPLEFTPVGDLEGLIVPVVAAAGLRGELVADDVSQWTGAIVVATRLDVQRRAAVGPSGGWSIEELVPDVWSVTLEHARVDSRELAEEVELAPGVMLQHVFDLSGDVECELAGRLTFNGEVPRGWLWSAGGLGMPRETFASDGSFRAELPEPGKVAWGANAPRGGHYAAGLRIALDLVPGTNELDVELQVGTLVLRGVPLPDQLVDHGGQIDMPIQVEWHRADGLAWAATPFTAADGVLRLEPVPAGTIQVRYAGDTEVSGFQAPVVLEVEVTAGETAEVDFPE